MEKSDDLINVFVPEICNKVKVSSVLNNLSSENGKQFLNDGSDETCWTSNQGKFQYIFACFDTKTTIKRIEITCSGGFCPKVFYFNNLMKLKFITVI